MNRPCAGTRAHTGPVAHAPIVAADATGIARAAGVLAAGGLVAFPTETVYGLGGDATDRAAVAAIFAAKGRPAGNPLIVHVPSLAQAERFAVVTAMARRLAARFWPGPLTLVLARRPGAALAPAVSAGLATVAVRAPRHPVAQRLLATFARPVAAPSANPSGAVSPTQASHVAEALDARVALILDGGAAPVGIESTVLDLTSAPPSILRPGAITREALEAVIGPLVPAGAPDAAHHTVRAPRAPGMFASHYAPAKRLRMDATTVAADEALLAFGAEPPAGAAAVFNLSPEGDLREAARNLFAMLRAADSTSARAIAVMAIPCEGLGAAINDRLRRAAAPRAAAPRADAPRGTRGAG